MTDPNRDDRLKEFVAELADRVGRDRGGVDELLHRTTELARVCDPDGDDAFDDELFAHVVLAKDATVSDAELRAAVSALTQSAVPRRFARHLAPFPVLPAEKIDALALRTEEVAVVRTLD